LKLNLLRRTLKKHRFIIITIFLALSGSIWLTFCVDRNCKDDIFGPEICDTDLVVDFLNVGKADCTVIYKNDLVILIDAGFTTPEGFVVRYLKDHVFSKRKLKNQIDLVVLTHPHVDHYGQMLDVFNNFKVKRFITSKSYVGKSDIREYRNLLNKIKSKNVKIEIAKANNTFKINDVFIKILGPLSQHKKINNNSVVLKIIFKNIKFLFTGDAEREEENELIRFGQNLNSDIIKIGHHGSKTSTSWQFLKAVKAKYAVISAGDHFNLSNLFPSKVVTKRLNQAGIKYFITKDIGTIRIAVSKDGTLKVPSSKEILKAA